MFKSFKQGTTLETGTKNQIKMVSKEGFTLNVTYHHNQKISQTYNKIIVENCYAQYNRIYLYKHIDQVSETFNEQTPSVD